MTTTESVPTRQKGNDPMKRQKAEDQIRESIEVLHIDDAGDISLRDARLRVAGQEVKEGTLVSTSGLILRASMEQSYHAGFKAGAESATKAVSEAFQKALEKTGDYKVTLRGV